MKLNTTNSIKLISPFLILLFIILGCSAALIAPHLQLQDRNSSKNILIANKWVGAKEDYEIIDPKNRTKDKVHYKPVDGAPVWKFKEDGTFTYVDKKPMKGTWVIDTLVAEENKKWDNASKKWYVDTEHPILKRGVKMETQDKTLINAIQNVTGSRDMSGTQKFYVTLKINASDSIPYIDFYGKPYKYQQ
jgi:hypothetical protein